jgi:hypothetical protein
MVKLHIEISNADLITKVVKATNNNERSFSNNNNGYRCSNNTKSQPDQSRGGAPKSRLKTKTPVSDCRLEIYADPRNDETPITLEGIQKTISTTVVSKPYEDDDAVSEFSSTRRLQD